MAGGKLPPRQKMIGMMYLVLTALLALNVSKDILDAFVIVNDGLENTKTNFKDKNDSQYTAFLNSYNENKEKVGPYWKQAQDVQALAEELVKYIDMVKANIIYQTDGLDDISMVIGPNGAGQDTVLSLSNVQSKDNYDIPTNLMIGAEPNAPKDGEYTALELKNKLIDFRTKLQSMIKEDHPLYSSLSNSFSFEDKVNTGGVPEKWESSNFYHVPLAACVTILSKIQTDVRNAESDAVKYLYSEVDAGSFKFNKLEAAVISPSNYVILGDTFRASVFLAAYDSTKNPVMRMGSGDYIDSVRFAISGDTVPINVIDGKGAVNIATKSEGEYTWNGVINFEAEGGKLLPFPFTTTYTVAKPSLVVAADKMNVFYKGVDNPVSISVPGVPADRITASISAGSMSKKGGGYVVRIKKGKEAIIRVSAQMPDGSKKNMGQMKFRVKTIPDPVPYVAQKTGSSSVRLAQLKATNRIFAKMENFDFEVEPVIQSFQFSMTLSGGVLVEEKVRGNRMSPKVKELINKQLRKNKKVYFEKIMVKMPDNTVRPIGPVILKAT